MELNNLIFDENTPAEFVIPAVDPNGSDFKVLLLSQNSSIISSLDIVLQKKTLGVDVPSRQKRPNSGDEVINRSIERTRPNNIQRAIAAAVGWSGLKNNGADVPFSKEECKKLFEMPSFYPYIQDMNEFMDEGRNFTRQSISGFQESE